MGLQGPWGSRGRPTGSQGVTRVGLQGLRESRADMIFVQLFTQPDFQAKICTPLKCVMAEVPKPRSFKTLWSTAGVIKKP